MFMTKLLNRGRKCTTFADSQSLAAMIGLFSMLFSISLKLGAEGIAPNANRPPSSLLLLQAPIGGPPFRQAASWSHAMSWAYMNIFIDAVPQCS